MEFKVGKFGSIVNGFAMDDADMDITIMTNSYINERDFLEILSGFLKMRLNSHDYSVKNIPNANVPLIKLVRKHRSVRNGKIDVDILVNNICGMINSEYLRTYSELKSVKHLGVLIKIWAKNNGLISMNRLSSYSFMLMMVYYLIKKNVVPNILKPIGNKQASIVVKRRKRTEETFKIENYFETEVDPKYRRKFNLYEHLMGFMRFYSPKGEFWKGKPLICFDTQA